MPLEQDTIDVVFAGGLDTKTDARQVTLGKFLVLQNMVFTAPKKIRRRYGGTSLTQNIEGGGTIASGSALFNRGSELLLVDNTSTLYSYDSSRSNWVNKGTMPSVSASLLSLGNTQYTARNVTQAIAANGLICAVFDLYDQTGVSNQYKGVAYSVTDSSTGQIVAGPTIFDSTTNSICPRVVYLGTNFVFYWIETDFSTTATVYATTLSSTAPTSAPPAKTAVTSGSTTSALNLTNLGFDAVTVGGNAYVAFTNRSGTPGTTTFQLTSAAPTVVNATVTLASTQAINTCCVADPNGNVVVGYITAATASAVVYNSSLVQQANPALDTGQTGLSGITGIGTANNTLTFFYSGTSAVGRGDYIRTNTLTTGSYTPGTASKLLGSVSVGGQAFKDASGNAYCVAWFSTLGTNGTDTQSTVYVVNASGLIIGGALQGGSVGAFATSGISGNGSSNTPYLVGTTIVSGSVFYTSQTRATRVIGQLAPGLVNSANLYQFSPTAVGFNLSDAANNYMRAQSSNYVLTSGSIPYMYDGLKPTEQGFLQYPWYVLASFSGGGSLTANSTYLYQVTYEWMDGQGQIHRSAPGPLNNSGAIGANTKATLTISTLRCTAKTGVMITVWRTVANGSIYYQVNNFGTGGSLYNDITVNTVTWVDTLADTAITSNPQLYTTGGVLADYPPSPLVSPCAHRNRIFGIDPTTGQIQYTKQVIPPAPLEFATLNTMGIDATGGYSTALGSLDDKLIVFKPNKIFYVFGQGPDSTGGNNDFTDALPLPGDIGCPYPKSVVQVPNKGLMFKSQKGWFLLDRGLGLSYIGADVESYNGLTVASVNLVPNTTQVRWTMTGTSPSHLVYDYLVGQWSVFTSGAALADATIWNAKHLNLVSGSGVASQESTSVYNDAGSFYAIGWTSPWIHLKDLQGYQRLYEALLLGKYGPDDQTLQSVTLTVDYNYDETNANGDRQTITAWGTNNSPSFAVQVRVRPKHPRRESMRLAWSESWSGGAFSGSADEFSGLTLRIGVSDKPYKLPASATYG